MKLLRSWSLGEETIQPVCVKTILTVLCESQEDNADEDFTPHGQACLETKFLSSGPFAVLYRATRSTVGGFVQPDEK